jgi:hypothetical protein
VLDTEPTSASIRIDGAAIGIAPLTTNLEYGEHLVEIQKHNYEGLIYKIMLKEPRVVEKKILSKEKGTLILDTDPSGMHVRIDQHEEYITPCAVTLNVGEHTFDIKEKNFEEVTKTFDIPKTGLLQKIPLKLRQAFYNLKTDPPGASVKIDDDDIGKTPINRNLNFGKHRVEVNLPGHDNLVYEISLNENGLTEIKELFPYFNHEVGIGFGFAYMFDKNMFRDINGDSHVKGGGIFWSFAYRYHFTPHLSVGLRLTGSYITLSHIQYVQDGVMKSEDLTFGPQILGAEGRWTFFRGKSEPYIFLSFGGVDGNLAPSSNSNNVISKVGGFTVGGGIGASISFSKNISLSVELCSSLGSGEWTNNVNPYFNDVKYIPSLIAAHIACSYRFGSGTE